MTSPNLESVAADSNVLLSAIAGKAAIRVFATPDLMIVTTDENVAEVHKYVPEFAARYGLSASFVNASRANWNRLVLLRQR